MPDPANHLLQAQKNERFYQQLDLDSTEFHDWAIIGLFYSALHYIDAYLATQGLENISNHGIRLNEVSRAESPLFPIYPSYRHLYQWSRWARYELIPCNKAEVEQLRDTEFTAVRDLVTALPEIRGVFGG